MGATAQGSTKPLAEPEAFREEENGEEASPGEQQRVRALLDRRGTFVSKNDAAWLKREVGNRMPQGRRLEILCWRGLSVGFLRTFIHERLGGRWLLRFVFWLEERFPHYFGERGQYPLVVITPKTQ